MTQKSCVLLEQQVNEKIWEAIAVEMLRQILTTPAKEMGAGLLVRNMVRKSVVTIGDYLLTLWWCTHVGNTSEIGLFKIVKEEGIGRRIMALVRSLEAYRDQEDALKAVAATLESLNPSRKFLTKLKDFKRIAKKKCRNGMVLQLQPQAICLQECSRRKRHRYIYSVSDAGALVHLVDNWKQKDYLMCLLLSQPSVTAEPCSQQDKRDPWQLGQKNWLLSLMDVVVVNQTWPWQEEATNKNPRIADAVGGNWSKTLSVWIGFLHKAHIKSQFCLI